jgi:hypothetical protein
MTWSISMSGQGHALVGHEDLEGRVAILDEGRQLLAKHLLRGIGDDEVERDIDVALPVRLGVIGLERFAQGLALLLHAEREDGGVAAERGRARPALETVGHQDAGPGGLGEVDVAVDPAGKDEPPGRVDHLEGVAEVMPESRDPSTPDGDVAGEGVGGGRDRAAANDGVEARHLGPARPRSPGRNRFDAAPGPRRQERRDASEAGRRASARRLQRGHGHAIRAEILDLLDSEEFGEADAGAVDAALHGADRAAHDRGCLLIGEALCADQQQRLALVRREPRKRRAEIVHVGAPVLLGQAGQPAGIGTIDILDLALSLAKVREIEVAQMVKSHALRFVPRSKRSMAPQARMIVSCTRSSALSTFPHSEIANARRLGSAASIWSRIAGSTLIVSP